MGKIEFSIFCHPFMRKGCSGAECRPWEACAPPPALVHKRVWVASSTKGKDALISDNRAHTLTVAAVVVVRADVARMEVQVVGVERARGVLR